MHTLKTTTLLLVTISSKLLAQAQDSSLILVAQPLEQVVIKAYEQNHQLQQTSAAINYVDQRQLNRFNNSSVLPVINATPGVRMEERSPGSYRLSIRGSSLRAPFGVRNVKIYYNDIPFTDPGGHTYFNQLGFYNFQSLEIIKGPGSSLYGAGTGGVMLINSMNEQWQQGGKLSYTLGSFNLYNLNAETRIGTADAQNVIRYQHLTSNGYREHSNMQRGVFSWDAKYKTSNRNTISAHFLYSNLYYQTPGALTLAEYKNNPKQDRPAIRSFRGASEAKAAVYEQTFLAGFTNRYQFTNRIQNTTTLYGAYSQLRNPTVQNYARSTEPHAGGRTVFKYDIPIYASTLDLVAGCELQQGYATVKTYKNLNGNPDTLQADDEINNRQYFGFVQATWQYYKWVVIGGFSVNKQHLIFARLNNYPYTELIREYDNEIAPRFAALYKATNNIALYLNVAKGFSPPTTAELLPSGADLNLDLRPENGWNYELGSKGYLLDQRLYYDISTFLFKLNNTIVVRRDAGGGNFFVNAGSTDQKGIEAYITYRLLQNTEAPLSAINLFTSYSYYYFRYQNFTQLEDDFSNNKLPSVAPHTVTFGLDVYTQPGIYANFTYNYTDAIPLDDANLAFSEAYHLFSLRVGYKRLFSNKYSIEVFAGADNLLDEQYSLGNDINGFNGRYYNAAPSRNYFAGITLGYFK